ncbi:alpha/beta hydrolase [Galbibacter sp. EGI 63066]|uniref:alpha/beta hydrolase n=1 Tax=Galbibacter sp. EGI 63066 TaxID=2993559 RepID=UPI0022490014|nr:alpha/beta hydrolase [Galbibacter sp. EGI 63066]MCX2680826.1 alpha/beta hydrolase [Galbibacter sp. EGI 63066]
MDTTSKENYQQSVKIPKPIVIFAKILQFISTALASKFASKLFATPIKHSIPKREFHMDADSKQEEITIPSIDKKVIVYSYGRSKKKILLVHGWSGRGTQLVKIADKFLEMEYNTVSFDAPAHGKAPGKVSNMSEFIEAVMEIEKKYGPFEAAVGHSLGGMTLLNAVKNGLDIKSMVIIGSGDIVTDIVFDFTEKLELKKEVGLHMKNVFDVKIGRDIDEFSASVSAKEVDIPVLVIHDKNDMDVPISSAHNIHNNLKNSKLLVTEGFGHRKILGNNEVIEQLSRFIEKYTLK